MTRSQSENSMKIIIANYYKKLLKVIKFKIILSNIVTINCTSALLQML